MCRYPYEAVLLKLAFVLSFCFSGLAFSQQRVYTVAGGYVGDGGQATAAVLSYPLSAAVDAGGNIYIADNDACRIRKISETGSISTIAGTGICGYTGDGGLATRAQITGSGGVAVDGQGNVFFSDSSNNRVRVVNSNGRITTVAGNGSYGFCGDGGPATQACLGYPQAVAVGKSDSGEVLYIADTNNNRIRMVSRKTGLITTVAGNGTRGYSGDGGPAVLASLDQPVGVAYYPKTRTLWISDTNNGAIRSVDGATGLINTFAKTLSLPEGLSVDRAGNVYVNYCETEVVEIQVPSGNIVPVAGSFPGKTGYNGDGEPATSAFLAFPQDVTVDPGGNILIVDSGNYRLRKVDSSGIITTVAGGYVGDGKKGVSASLESPAGIALDKRGNLYVAEYYADRIRKVDKFDTISTVVGTGLTGYSGDGGPASQAQLWGPSAVTFDNKGNLFIADLGNGAIRKVDSKGTITTFVGQYFYAYGLTADNSGNIYASADCCVWKFTPDGARSVVAGVYGEEGYNGDGIPATQAYLAGPAGLWFDDAGNLYITESFGHRVRVVDLDGIINTVAGNGTCGFSGDGGPATDAMLCVPEGVAGDSNGNLYIADDNNGRIRIVDKAGVIDTFAGDGVGGYNGNGLPALETTLIPVSVISTFGGVVGYSDIGSDRVRVIH